MTQGIRQNSLIIFQLQPFEYFTGNLFGIEIVNGNIHNDFFIFGTALDHISVDVEEVDNSVAGTGFYLRIIAQNAKERSLRKSALFRQCFQCYLFHFRLTGSFVFINYTPESKKNKRGKTENSVRKLTIKHIRKTVLLYSCQRFLFQPLLFFALSTTRPISSRMLWNTSRNFMIADHGFFSGFQKFEIPRIAVAGKFHFPRPAQAGAVSVPFVKRLRKKHCGTHDSDFFSNPPAETEPPHGGTDARRNP